VCVCVSLRRWHAGHSRKGSRAAKEDIALSLGTKFLRIAAGGKSRNAFVFLCVRTCDTGAQCRCRCKGKSLVCTHMYVCIIRVCVCVNVCVDEQ